jgi:hypothetical protein
MSQPGEPVATSGTAELEARVAAMSALVKSLLTTLMLRGLLTRAEIAPLIADAEALMGTGAGAVTARSELRAIEADLPNYMREAMGPPPDDDDHDH